MNLTIKTPDQITPEVKQFIIKHHYLHSCPLIAKFVFTVYDNEVLAGAAIVTNFSRFQAKSKYKDCLELSRFVLLDSAPMNSESFLLGYITRYFKQNTNVKGIISYADPTVGHQGTIYKASNFHLIGTSSRSYHYVDSDGKWLNKKTVWDKAKAEGLMESEYVKKNNYLKITEKKKFIYFYEIVNGYLEKLKSVNFDIDEVMIKKTYFHKASNRWIAHIKTKKHKQLLGYYKTEDSALAACDKFEEEIYGTKMKSSCYPEEIFHYENKPDDFNPTIHAIIRVGPRVFFIDREFISHVLERKWNVFSTYLTRSTTCSIDRIFHRYIMSAEDGYIIDHINGMKNDNRRINLRKVKHSLNNHNVDRRQDENDFYGVRFKKGKYESSVTFNYKSYYLGRYDTAIEAAKAYDERVVALYGRDARTNFSINGYTLPIEPEIARIQTKSFKLTKKKKCISEGCNVFFYSSNFDICEKCRMRLSRKERADLEGREIKKYKERVSETLSICKIDGCEKRVMSRNLCSAHYYHERKSEDPQLREKIQSKRKKYKCIHPDCDAQYQHKENLCKIHWLAKYGKKPGKIPGRIAGEKIDCKMCGKIQSATKKCGLCPKCYAKCWREQKKNTASNNT